MFQKGEVVVTFVSPSPSARTKVPFSGQCHGHGILTVSLLDPIWETTSQSGRPLPVPFSHLCPLGVGGLGLSVDQFLLRLDGSLFLPTGSVLRRDIVSVGRIRGDVSP